MIISTLFNKHSNPYNIIFKSIEFMFLCIYRKCYKKD